jgi:hypothetical protein
VLPAKGAGARELSAKIRVQLLREIGFLLQICFLLRPIVPHDRLSGKELICSPVSGEGRVRVKGPEIG